MKICKIDGCEKRAEALSMCQMHRRRLKLYGDPALTNRLLKKPKTICAWCDEPSSKQYGKLRLCIMHYRMSMMRVEAKYRGKAVPSKASLAAMVAEGMECIGCGRHMNWSIEEGRSTQVTLQHDRSGRMLLLCRGCNSKHFSYPGDTFYDIPRGHKLCRACNTVKEYSEFYPRKGGVSAYCKTCQSVKSRAGARNP